MRQMACHPDLVLRSKTSGTLFIQDDGETTICRICNDIAEDAIQSKCRHIFDRECIRQYLDSALENNVCHSWGRALLTMKLTYLIAAGLPSVPPSAHDRSWCPSIGTDRKYAKSTARHTRASWFWFVEIFNQDRGTCWRIKQSAPTGCNNKESRIQSICQFSWSYCFPLTKSWVQCE